MRTIRKNTVVFAGGGHAALYSLLRTGDFTRLGCDVVLVNPSPYLHYSGMATGVISGSYGPDETRIDVRRLVERGGGRFVEERVEKVLAPERTLLLEDGRRVPYDVACLCPGSGVEAGNLAEGERSVPIKPVENAGRIRARLREPARDGSRLLIVGGGAAGCEVAANVARAAEGSGWRITLAEAGPSLLGTAPKAAQRAIFTFLEDRGVEVLTDSRVSSHRDGSAVTAAGREIRADLLVAATGITPSPLPRRSGLLTGEDGGLWVDHHLRSPSDDRLFGGGDAISFRGEPLPRLGVFAIRQGPILYHNLRAALRNQPLREFIPQSRYLYVLNLGDGTGLALYGRLTWRGRLSLILKHRIDRRFMEKYR